MRGLPALCLLVLGIGPAGWQPSEGACDPAGEIRFLCGPVDAEDLVPIPESPWVVISGMQDEGQLHLADSRDHTSFAAYPGDSPTHRHDTDAYGECPGPLTAGFRPHGLNLDPGPPSGGTHTLYVVRHGGREAVEIFELRTTGATPSLTWIGCVIPPDTVNGNAVAALPGGGFALTNFTRRGDPDVMASLRSGGPTGEVWEWHPNAGWRVVPGSETSGANGLAISPDGQWFYLGAWGSQSFIRLSRGRLPVSKDVIHLGFNVDNVHWAPDGSLLAAGQGGGMDAVLACMAQGQCTNMTSDVVRIDPNSLAVDELIRHPSDDFVISGTAAIQVGDEIWVGSLGGADRIARFPSQP